MTTGMNPVGVGGASARPAFTTWLQDRLREARADYRQLCQPPTPRWSLADIYDREALGTVELALPVRNEHSAAAEQEVADFAMKHQIARSSLAECITAATYTFPFARLDRLVTIGKLYVILFYLNDNCGRDKICHLAETEREAVYALRDRLLRVSRTLRLESDATSVDEAVLSTFCELRDDSDPNWFPRFASLWRDHLDGMMRVQEIRIRGFVPELEAYLDERVTASGMAFTVALFEYASGRYLDWPLLRAVGMAEDVERVRTLGGRLGALVNDLFSFENEFVDELSDNNLIPVLMLNRPELDLAGAVGEGISLTRRCFEEFAVACAAADAACDVLSETEPGLCSGVESFVRASRLCARTNWDWAMSTARYKRPRSIFRENGRPSMASGASHRDASP